MQKSLMPNRRSFLRRVGRFAAGAAAVGAGAPFGLSSSVARARPAPPRAKRPPNIVFFFIDDLGWRDLGCMGSEYYETPRIDALAREGMLFTNAYANAPNCAPSRASLMTGQYTPRHGIYTVGSSERGNVRKRRLVPTPNRTTLDLSKTTIPEALAKAGYVSAAMGKWHLGEPPEAGPCEQGFDRNVGGSRRGHPPRYFPPYNLSNLTDGPPGEYLTDRLTDEAEAFIDENREKPFFLYLSHYAVHTPIQAPREMANRYRGKLSQGGQNDPTYAAMIESVDHSVGRVLDKLDALDLAENTFVLFFSDNGGHGGVTDNRPLRGSKGMLYEGGIREPMIARFPGRVPAGTTCDTPVIGTDFFPTFLELAGAPTPDSHILDGQSLMALLTGEGASPPEDRPLFWHFPAYLEPYAGFQGDWRTTPVGAMRRGKWKLLEFFEDGRLELYDLEADPCERNNLADRMPARTREMHEIMLAWRREVDAPVPTERNPEYEPKA